MSDQLPPLEKKNQWRSSLFVVTSGPLGDSLRLPFKQQLKEVWGPIKVYFALVFVMISVFSVVALGPWSRIRPEPSPP